MSISQYKHEYLHTIITLFSAKPRLRKKDLS